MDENGRSCPATIDQMCDQADQFGCPYGGPGLGQFLDWLGPPLESGSTFAPLPLPQISIAKPDVPAGKKMCQYGAPGDKVYFLVKGGSNVDDSTDFIQVGNEAYYIFNDWTPSGRNPADTTLFESWQRKGGILEASPPQPTGKKLILWFA